MHKLRSKQSKTHDTNSNLGTGTIEQTAERSLRSINSGTTGAKDQLEWSTLLKEKERQPNARRRQVVLPNALNLIEKSLDEKDMRLVHCYFYSK
jgi:hypothetical protein